MNSKSLLFVGDPVMVEVNDDAELLGHVKFIQKCQPNGHCLHGINGYPLVMGTPKIQVSVDFGEHRGSVLYSITKLRKL